MNNFRNYYYPSCSEGTTSVSFSYDSSIIPLKELLMFRLQQIAYYVNLLNSLDADVNQPADKIIDFIALVVTNLDFKREKFELLVKDLEVNKQNLENLYIRTCEELNISQMLLDKETEMTEKNLFGFQTVNTSEFSEIIMHLVQSASKTLVELKEYGEYDLRARNSIIKLLSKVNFIDKDEASYYDDIIQFAKENYRITLKLSNLLIKKYGPVKKQSVSMSPKQGKCILVTGHFYRDLEKILDATKGTGIDIYTHSDMLMAHAYSSFEEYPNLKGHYQGLSNNINLDFATFPGPILITSHCAPHSDLIRGQIYTIGSPQWFGYEQIVDDNFTSLIEYAKSSPGFGADVEENIISVGYDEKEIETILESLVKKLKNNSIRHLFVLGSMQKYQTKDKYYLDFMKHCPKDCAVLSFSYKYECKNCYHINSYYDFSLIWGILEKLNGECCLKDLSISMFLTKCTLQTVSNIFDLITLGITDIYLPCCYPNVINPKSVNVLIDMFGVKQISASPETDINYILNNTK